MSCKGKIILQPRDIVDRGLGQDYLISNCLVSYSDTYKLNFGIFRTNKFISVIIVVYGMDWKQSLFKKMNIYSRFDNVDKKFLFL